MIPSPPTSTLFPYTTLFRSRRRRSTRCCSSPRHSYSRSCSTPHWRGTGAASRHSISCSRSEEHTSELQSRRDLVCRLLLEKKKRSSRRALQQLHEQAPNAVS